MNVVGNDKTNLEGYILKRFVVEELPSDLQRKKERGILMLREQVMRETVSRMSH